MLEQWDRLSPNEPSNLLSEAFLCSSHGPDQGLSPLWEPHSASLSPCPLLPSALGLTEPPLGSPFCSQQFLGVQRCLGCPRLRTWCLGLPIVHHTPSWGQGLHIARQPPGATWKACSNPSASAGPEHQNSGGTRVFSHSLFPPCSLPHRRAELDGSQAISQMFSWVCRLSWEQLIIMDPARGNLIERQMVVDFPDLDSSFVPRSVSCS